MTEEIDRSMADLEERLKTVWEDLGYAVAVSNPERIAEGIKALQEISADHRFIQQAWAADRAKAVDITQQTINWLRGAYPITVFPHFHKDLDLLSANLTKAIQEEDEERIDHWLVDLWHMPLPLKTQGEAVAGLHAGHGATNPLGLAPVVLSALENSKTERTGETDKENPHG